MSYIAVISSCFLVTLHPLQSSVILLEIQTMTSCTLKEEDKMFHETCLEQVPNLHYTRLLYFRSKTAGDKRRLFLIDLVASFCSLIILHSSLVVLEILFQNSLVVNYKILELMVSAAGGATASSQFDKLVKNF